MMTIYILKQVDPSGKDYLNNNQIDIFLQIKRMELGYDNVDIQIPQSGGIFLKTAPISACRTQQEAEKLREAVVRQFPNLNLIIEQKDYPEGQGATWYGCRSYGIPPVK